MRRFEDRASRPFSVEVNPSAWLPVGRMSAQSCQQVLQALERIAELATLAPVSPDALRAGDHDLFVMTVNGTLEARYELDLAARVVRLVDLSFI
ncbi:MAG: hypothetical protein IRZ16_12240 [Myxococcaceae bacterium]|nr:hypothetical protein [Myxococcaceae bacterium]